MVFNSIVYLLFLSVTVVAYYLFPQRLRWIWLLIASICYYLSFIPVFAVLLTGLAVINFFLAKWLAGLPEEKKRGGLILIIALNVLSLAFFKYFNIFFPENHWHLFTVDFFYHTSPVSRMILPLGLSYITFTLLSYQIEIRRKNILPEKHFGYFSLYLFFFPKITQGPIERPQQLIPQLHLTPSLDFKNIGDGLKLMLWGYFKKLVIADRLAIYVNAVYDNNQQHNGTTLLVATIFYSFQIYADFSGYTDIALGSAKLFGFNLTSNFNRPYLSKSVKEFWNRWHITLSKWLRDYVFLPMSYYLSNKMKKQKYLYLATDKWIYLIVSIITFALCGIWHGVGWNYLIWGILFGIYLTWSNWTKNFSKNVRKKLHIRKDSPYLMAYKIILTFILVSFTWIFFRANSFSEAISIVKKIFTSAGVLFYHSRYDFMYSIIGIAALIAVELKLEYFNDQWSILYSKYSAVRIGGIVVLVISILLLGVLDGGQFIYFQF